MSNELKMFGRYALAIGVSYAIGRGWITPSAGDVITRLAIEVAGLAIAFGPALYAAMKVDNTPKTP